MRHSINSFLNTLPCNSHIFGSFTLSHQNPHANLYELVYSMLGLVPGVLYRTLNTGSWAKCCHVSRLCLILHLAQVEHLSIPGMFFQFLLVHIVRSSSCLDKSSLFYPKQGQPCLILLM